jgi:hypothetical protein
VIRRRLTLKRVDPWSVLKFGFVVNVALMLVAMLGFWILWIVVQRLGLVEQFCDSVGTIVLDLQECSLNGGNIFRTALFLGLLGVVVQTGIMVFGAFLYNLIADLTGGLAFTFLDDSGQATATTARRAPETTGASAPTGSTATGSRGTAPTGATAPRRPGPSSSGPSDQSSAPRRPTPDGPPPAPPGEGAGQGRSSSQLWGDPTWSSNDRT